MYLMTCNVQTIKTVMVAAWTITKFIVHTLYKCICIWYILLYIALEIKEHYRMYTCSQVYLTT